jgi:hypothetical protein
MIINSHQLLHSLALLDHRQARGYSDIFIPLLKHILNLVYVSSIFLHYGNKRQQIQRLELKDTVETPKTLQCV